MRNLSRWSAIPLLLLILLIPLQIADWNQDGVADVAADIDKHEILEERLRNAEEEIARLRVHVDKLTTVVAGAGHLAATLPPLTRPGDAPPVERE